MLNLQNLMIEPFVAELRTGYQRNYGGKNPEYADIIVWAGYLALENIANSDILYHNIEHTIMVTLVGQEILRGKHLREGGVTPEDWLHFIIATLCHDIGYVKGVCKADGNGVYATGVGDGTVELPPGGTDAALTPYHVDRGQQFIPDVLGCQGGHWIGVPSLGLRSDSAERSVCWCLPRISRWDWSFSSIGYIRSP